MSIGIQRKSKRFNDTSLIVKKLIAIIHFRVYPLKNWRKIKQNRSENLNTLDCLGFWKKVEN